jgi:hypothetical protein
MHAVAFDANFINPGAGRSEEDHRSNFPTFFNLTNTVCFFPHSYLAGAERVLSGLETS